MSGAVVSAYATWIADFPSIPLADRDPEDDPDNDGSSNAAEFALGDTPNNGSNNPKVYSIVADSSADGDFLKEMLMTIAVRSGTPAFTGSPSPSATQDGITYKVQGSNALSSFTTIATPVVLVAPPRRMQYRRLVTSIGPSVSAAQMAPPTRASCGWLSKIPDPPRILTRGTRQAGPTFDGFDQLS